MIATAVRAYDLEIFTGPSAEERTPGYRAELLLRNEEGDPIGHIHFNGPDVTLPRDFTNRAGGPELHLHTEMLSSVLALLHSEKPLFVELNSTGDVGRLTTTEDSIR